jgi:hypothetical protein
VISELLARLVEPHSGARRLSNLLLGMMNLGCCGEYGLFVLARDHQNTIRITAQKVTWAHPRLTNVDWDVGSLHLDPIFARAHPVPTAVDGIAKLNAQRDVSADAVNNRSAETSAMRNFSQNVTPHSGILPSAVVEHHYAARRDIVDVVTNGPRRTGRWSVQNRERTAGHTEARVARLDPMTLTCNTQPIERIAQRGGVEFLRTRDTGIRLVSRHFTQPLSIVS